MKRIAKIAVFMLLAVSLLLGSAPSVLMVSAANNDEYVWTNGSLENTHEVIGTATHNTENTLDGDGAAKVEFDTDGLGARIRFSTPDGQPVDLTGYNQLTVYLYISNPEILYGAGVVMLHCGDAVTQYDLRQIVEADGATVSSTYAAGWNKITLDITGDTSLAKMYHMYIFFTWYQDRVPGAYYMVDSITFSKVDEPKSYIENLGGWNADDAGTPDVTPDPSEPADPTEPTEPVEPSDTPAILLEDTEDGLEMITHNIWDGTEGSLYLDEGMIGDAIYFQKTGGVNADLYITTAVNLAAYSKVTFWAYIDDAEALSGALNLIRFRYHEVDENGGIKELVETQQSLTALHDWVDGWNLVTLDLSDFVVNYSMTSHYKVGDAFPWDKANEIVWLIRIAGDFTCAIDNMVAGSALSDEGLSFEAPAEEDVPFPETIAQGQTIQVPQITSDAALTQTIVTCDDQLVEVVDGKFVVEEAGTYVIKIVLSDEFNRSVVYSRTYTIDAKPPKINFIKYYDENNTVELGTVVDLSKITAADGVDPNPSISFTVTLDGAAVEVSADQTFTVAEKGTYTVLVTATDASGNVAEATLTFTAESGSGAEAPSGDPTIVIVIVAAVVVVAAVVIVLLVLKNKKKAA